MPASPTQMMVERQLAAEGKKRSELGREKFIERVWEWKSTTAERSRSRCGGWAHRWTGSANISRWTENLSPRGALGVFPDLHEECLIYRGSTIVKPGAALRNRYF